MEYKEGKQMRTINLETSTYLHFCPKKKEKQKNAFPVDLIQQLQLIVLLIYCTNNRVHVFYLLEKKLNSHHSPLLVWVVTHRREHISQMYCFVNNHSICITKNC